MKVTPLSPVLAKDFLSSVVYVVRNGYLSSIALIEA
jgi:hypothetical protein